MPYRPLISKIRCHNPNKNKARVCNRNYLVYIGTREGVDLTNSSFDKSFKESIEKIESLNDENITPDAANEVYLKYISERPRSHGLFGNIDTNDITSLANKLADITHSGVCVYRGIVSLHELDALSLGYDKKSTWETYMYEVMPEIAKQFKIPIEHLSWTAAVHMEKGHPHCHWMMWRTDNHVQSPFIHPTTQDKCREIFYKTMFAAEREQEILNKTLARDSLIEFGKNFVSDGLDLHHIAPVPGKLKNVTLDILFQKISELTSLLPQTGRITYQLISPELKSKVDEITNTLLSHPDFAKEYSKYISSVEAISKTYSASQAKNNRTVDNAKFDIKKRLGNIILVGAKELRKELSTIEREERNKLFKENEKNQLVTASCFSIFRASFSALFKEKASFEDSHEFKSTSKEALKIAAKKKGIPTKKEDKENYT